MRPEPVEVVCRHPCFGELALGQAFEWRGRLYLKIQNDGRHNALVTGDWATAHVPLDAVVCPRRATLEVC